MAKQPSPNRPEKKFGPYTGHPGVAVSVWLNRISTDQGPKQTRSITISPRRYRDKNGQWTDASSFWLSDLPVLTLALQEALAYCLTTPIPGDEARNEG